MTKFKELGLMATAVRFCRDEDGQDLIEYTLLMAFVCLASAAIFIEGGSNVNQIWSSSNSVLTGAANTASS